MLECARPWNTVVSVPDPQVRKEHERTLAKADAVCQRHAFTSHTPLLIKRKEKKLALTSAV